MAIFRQYIAPFLIVLVFLVALAAVSARIFLPSDMASPAPMTEVDSASQPATTSKVNAEAELSRLESLALPTSAGLIP